jgi:hypothetical protein
MFFPLGINELKGGPEQLSSDVFHFREYLSLKLVMLVRKCCIEIPLKKIVGYFIGGFIFPIFLSFLLDGVVGEMDHFVHVLYVVPLAARPYVSLFVPVAADGAIVGSNQEEMADVEFPTIIEEGLDVLLHN